MGSLEHANPFMTVLFCVMCAIIVGSVVLAQRGRKMTIRRIPGLSAIEEAIGRATNWPPSTPPVSSSPLPPRCCCPWPRNR